MTYNVKPLGLDPYFSEGYVCPETGRVAVKVSDFEKSRLNGDVYAYYYDKEQAYFGFDPWRLVEGIDTYSYTQKDNSYDLWFARGHELKVDGDSTIFLNSKHADVVATEKEARQ